MGVVYPCPIPPPPLRPSGACARVFGLVLRHLCTDRPGKHGFGTASAEAASWRAARGHEGSSGNLEGRPQPRAQQRGRSGRSAAAARAAAFRVGTQYRAPSPAPPSAQASVCALSPLIPLWSRRRTWCLGVTLPPARKRLLALTRRDAKGDFLNASFLSGLLNASVLIKQTSQKNRIKGSHITSIASTCIVWSDGPISSLRRFLRRFQRTSQQPPERQHPKVYKKESMCEYDKDKYCEHHGVFGAIEHVHLCA